MYWRCWSLTVIVFVPLFNPGDFPHPEETLVVVGPLELDVVVGAPGPEEVVGPGVQLPERHWEYHGFEYWQHAPAIHCVGPVQLLPPPKLCVSAILVL